MLKKILITLTIIIIALVVVISRQPDEFRVTRTATINGKAEDVFVQVNDLKKWDAWSPWAKLDPNAKNSFEGPEAGKKAKVSWVGNSDVGEGSMEITESRENEFIKFRLDFLKPFKATNTAEFKFKAKDENEKTEVTWTMYGKNNFIGKAMGLVFDCEKMVGAQFEQGLKSLDEIVQKEKAQSIEEPKEQPEGQE